MVDRVVPFLIQTGDIVPARSRATLLNEMAMALIEVINVYGKKKISKLGKISKISLCFWPVRLIPLNDTRACVCSYLLNKQEKLDIGKFSKVPPPPENVIKGADPQTFLDSFEDYNKSYLRKSKWFKRGTVIQDALFSSSEIEYFKNFFLNRYDLSSFNEEYFILEGDPIAKSVNEIKIIPEIKDFVELKDIQMLDNYASQITKLCDKWVSKGTKRADKIKGTTVDTSSEEKQLAMLNKELQREKEKDLQDSSEALLKSGKYKINDKSGEFYNLINAFRNSVDRLKNGVSQKDLFLVEESLKDLDLKYKDIGNSISRYKTEIAQLKKNLDQEKSDIQSLHNKKIAELQSKIDEVKKQIEAKHQELSQDLSDVEDILVEIKELKRTCLENIESIKDDDLTRVQEFFQDYTLELKTGNEVVGIPIFIFYFLDPNTNQTTERAPVLPTLVEKGKVVSTKVKDGFRDKLRDLMNKFNPMINLVENKGDEVNLMDIKNLDTRLEEAINDLRIKKILGKKIASKARDIIDNLVW
ncbi:MAG: hypothetical protein EU548_03185 [Promethearchaeota archaeon]|nr:MAG: hypothetical protein EU548_03185 [Candidatus Lokiarchaeota archaeon]